MSQEVNVIGKIKQINLNAGNANYEKSEVIVTTDEQYPQHILIEFGGVKSHVPDSYKVGDQVNISVNLRGREWVNPQGETKYFNSIQGWKMANIQPAYNAPAAQAQLAETIQQTQSEEDEDLPFN